MDTNTTAAQPIAARAPEIGQLLADLQREAQRSDGTFEPEATAELVSQWFDLLGYSIIRDRPGMRAGTTYEGHVTYADDMIVSLQCFEGRHGECPDPSCAGGTPADDGIGMGPLANGYYCECPAC